MFRKSRVCVIYLRSIKSQHPVRKGTRFPRCHLAAVTRFAGFASITPILHTNRNTTTKRKKKQQPPYRKAAVKLMDTLADESVKKIDFVYFEFSVDFALA